MKPNIVQINLAMCCVVPPALQTFTKENDIQLLTHSDPCRRYLVIEKQLIFESYCFTTLNFSFYRNIASGSAGGDFW